jgi:hypothetical protein
VGHAPAAECPPAPYPAGHGNEGGYAGPGAFSGPCCRPVSGAANAVYIPVRLLVHFPAHPFPSAGLIKNSFRSSLLPEFLAACSA